MFIFDPIEYGMLKDNLQSLVKESAPSFPHPPVIFSFLLLKTISENL